MKKVLFLIMIVGCFVGVTFGSTSTLQNDIRIKNNIRDFPAAKTLFQAKSSTASATENSNPQCTNPQPPSSGGARMTPSCYDMYNDDPPDDPHGDSQKGALPLAQHQSLIAKYYIENPNTGIYEYSESKPLVGYESGGFTFHYELPTWNDEQGNTFYRIDVVDRSSSSGNVIIYGYLEIVYPVFIVPPPDDFPY